MTWGFVETQFVLKHRQRARGASYRLLKHKTNNYYIYMYTLFAKKIKMKNKTKQNKNFKAIYEHYVKFAVQ